MAKKKAKNKAKKKAAKRAPDYAKLVEEAEKAVAEVKDPELRSVAFGKILDTLLQGKSPQGSPATGGTPQWREAKKTKKGADKTSGAKKEAGTLDLTDVVNLVKNCDEAEAIETQILDRTSQVDRTLLPLYIVHEHLGNEFALTSGDVSQVMTDLGIPISRPNASRTLSGTASRYVIGDKVRKKGQRVWYKLSRRGVQYLKSVLQGAKREG